MQHEKHKVISYNRYKSDDDRANVKGNTQVDFIDIILLNL